MVGPTAAKDERRDDRYDTTRGFVFAGLPFDATLDYGGVEIKLVLLRLPVVPVVALIALQALVLSQLGMRLGERIGKRAREGAERWLAQRSRCWRSDC